MANNRDSYNDDFDDGFDLDDKDIDEDYYLGVSDKDDDGGKGAGAFAATPQRPGR